MSNKAEQALNVIEQYIDDLDEIGAISVINHIMSQWDIDLSDWGRDEDN